MMQTPVLQATARISHLCRRNIGLFAPALQKASDPIQQLFLDKIREYQSKRSGGKLVEPSPELENELKSNKERVYRQFDITPGEDLSKFPTFAFKDKPIEDPGLSSYKKGK